MDTLLSIVMTRVESYDIQELESEVLHVEIPAVAVTSNVRQHAEPLLRIEPDAWHRARM